jgi:hemerythrin-like domain-containing protein
MQHIELTAEEVETLREVLESEIREIEVEVFRTDTHDFKEKLKDRRTILNHLLGKLGAAPVST